jgi:glycosyltransferase involved in cell wall biosynthesis
LSSSPNPLVSIVVTTKNEESNIENCLKSIRDQSYENIELIVVDNYSTDNTRTLAARYTKNVVLRGPERCAQRNFGLLEVAIGEYGMFIDADMILGPELVETAVFKMGMTGAVGLYIHEVVLGNGLLARIRRFERMFYTGTPIDCVRFFQRGAFLAVGGFDAELLAGGEDWDLDRKLLSIGSSLVLEPGRPLLMSNSFMELMNGVPSNLITGAAIFHNDQIDSYFDYFDKKARYSPGLRAYVTKWGSNDSLVKQQVGATNRLFLIFFRCGRWRLIPRHLHLLVLLLVLKTILGIQYLAFRIQARRRRSSAIRRENA